MSAITVTFELSSEGVNRMTLSTEGVTQSARISQDDAGLVGLLVQRFMSTYAPDEDVVA